MIQEAIKTYFPSVNFVHDPNYSPSVNFIHDHLYAEPNQ